MARTAGAWVPFGGGRGGRRAVPSRPVRPGALIQRWGSREGGNERQTVNVGCVHGLAAKGLGGPGVDADVGAADGCQHAAGVGGGAGQRRVAVHGADSEEVQRWVAGGEDDGEGILVGWLRPLEPVPWSMSRLVRGGDDVHRALSALLD